MNFEQFDQLLNPIICVSKEGSIKYYNHICSIFFRQSPRKIAKLNHISELITTDSINFDEMIAEVIASNSPQVSPEITFKNDDIGEMTLILKFILVEGEVIINILDFSIEKQLHEKYKQQVAELKETHEQILTADKLTALGEMIAGISHEVSTPLTIVNDRLMALEDSLNQKDIKQSEEILKEVNTEYKRVLRIISGMQSFVRNQEDDFIITDINRMLNDVTDFFEGLNYPSSYKIKINENADQWVMANPLKLQQVLINLIKNAFDAFKGAKQEEGLVEISLGEDDLTQSYTITISDNGPGIKKENEDKIFEMFFTTKSIGEGTGLGLSITKKILEAHNGDIRLNETDTGASFTINIPFVEVGSFTQTNKYLQGELDSEGEKILLFGSDIDLLNKVYQAYSHSDAVFIFSKNMQKMQGLADFLMIDKVVLFEKAELNFNVPKVIDCFEGSEEDKIKGLKDVIK
tara:strand:- start:160838 stop:162226 length:1389 start_codon:yes stop_codon:yes gene_type:complete